jgi:predicted MFS family arabinose efflux permease
VLGVAVAAQVGVSVIDQGMPTLTGFIKADLHISAATAGLAVSSFAAGKIFGSYAAGVAADRLGERRVLIFGALTTAAFAAIASFAPLAVVFPLLFLAGVAGASSTPAGGRLVLLAFPRSRHGLALGIRQTGIPMGGLIAAAVLPWVAGRSSWRWSLLVAAGIAVVAVIPMMRLRLDRTAPTASPREMTRGVLRDRNIGLLTLWGCLVVTGQYAILAFLALYLHQRAGFSLGKGSLLVAVANASGIVGRVAWGAVSDRAVARGRKPLLLVLTAACLAGALLLLALPRSAPGLVVVAVAIFAGLALIGYQGLWVTMIAEAAGPERVGAATGLAVTFVTAAIALSPPFYGLVADLAGTYRAIWAVLAVILGLAFVPALLIRE